LLLARADSWPEAIIITLAPVIVAPIFEELLFRGFFYRMLRDRMGVYGAVLFTSFLFAAVHPSVLTVLPLFALGAVFALLYEATGSILPSIVAHAMHNLASVGMLYVMLQ
ncbi:MAG: CPBP family intramembrane metalloprotease, partial [Myxococcales bacterium]|nr:CPBP family intramembrane metalloprotease [Myxococcales bacterium]